MDGSRCGIGQNTLIVAMCPFVGNRALLIGSKIDEPFDSMGAPFQSLLAGTALHLLRLIGQVLRKLLADTLLGVSCLRGVPFLVVLKRNQKEDHFFGLGRRGGSQKKTDPLHSQPKVTGSAGPFGRRFGRVNSLGRFGAGNVCQLGLGGTISQLGPRPNETRTQDLSTGTRAKLGLDDPPQILTKNKFQV